jgi:hypothetical protein
MMRPEERPLLRPNLLIVLLVGALTLMVHTTDASAHEKKDESLPPPPVSMRVIAPSAKGQWLLRIDNEGEEPVRVAADVRLLSFEVFAPATRRGKLHGWATRAAVCDGPSAFYLEGHFPIDRELVLAPGQSFVEEFDPRLICFGKNADLIQPGTKVLPRLGWKPNKRRGMSTAPFAVDHAHRPRKFRPLRRIEGPMMLLSHSEPVVYGSTTEGRSEPPALEKKEPPAANRAPGDGKGKRRPKQAKRDEAGGDDDADKPPPKPRHRSAEDASNYEKRPVSPRRKVNPPPPDDLAARLTLTASRYADASHPTDVSVQVVAHNVGQRPLFVALRNRMLSFSVEGPNGVVSCPRPSSNHKVPRDLFRTMHHGTHENMSVLLAEVCPAGTFDRPGLYVATPVLHAEASGREYGLSAATGVATTRSPGDPGKKYDAKDDATLVRVRKGPVPFYRAPAKAIPTRILPK